MHLRSARPTLHLARAVTENDPDATALIVTGSAALGSFELPQRVDTVKLPVFRREADGTLYAATLGVDMPITTGVYLMLFEGKNPVEAGIELRSRQLKSEYE